MTNQIGVKQKNVHKSAAQALQMALLPVGSTILSEA